MDEQVPAKKELIYATMGTLGMHHYHDLLLFMIHHPYRRFVYQLTYLNLIELCWKVLRSLELRGQRFETWNEVVAQCKRVCIEGWLFRIFDLVAKSTWC